jgi:peroxidase
VLLMAFGQFIDHDVDHVPVQDLDCCTNDGKFAENAFVGAKCFPIKIPQSDPFHKKKICMNFVRSDAAPRLDCSPGPLEQLNQITHWLDSSNVYGSDEEEARELR